MGTCVECGTEANKITKQKCQKCYQREYYSDPKNKEKKRQRAKKTYYKRHEYELERARAYRNKREFASLRYEVLERDGFQCVRCGKQDTPDRLAVHHKDRSGFSSQGRTIEISDKINNQPDNLETLCMSCHLKEHHAATVEARLRNRDKTHKQALIANPNLKWAKNYDCCISCGTTKVRHGGKGLCRTCRLKIFKGELRVQEDRV